MTLYLTLTMTWAALSSLQFNEVDVETEFLKKSDASCDVACLMYDISDPHLFNYCASIYKVSYRTIWRIKCQFLFIFNFEISSTFTVCFAAVYPQLPYLITVTLSDNPAQLTLQPLQVFTVRICNYRRISLESWRLQRLDGPTY